MSALIVIELNCGASWSAEKTSSATDFAREKSSWLTKIKTFSLEVLPNALSAACSARLDELSGSIFIKSASSEKPECAITDAAKRQMSKR